MDDTVFKSSVNTDISVNTGGSSYNNWNFTKLQLYVSDINELRDDFNKFSKHINVYSAIPSSSKRSIK